MAGVLGNNHSKVVAVRGAWIFGVKLKAEVNMKIDKKLIMLPKLAIAFQPAKQSG